MNRKIKVLRIIGECKNGGTENIALNYYKNIDHSRFAMDFLFFGESLSRFNCELEANGDRVINVTDYTVHLLKSIEEIREAVSDGHYDIVHSQLNALNFLPLIGAAFGGAKVRIASNHSTANLKYETRKSIIKYLVRPTAGLLATDYAACSEYAGRWCFGKRVVRNGKLHVIKNAIDLEKFSYADSVRTHVRAEESWDGKFVIGHAGRFTEQKNHRFVVEIFAQIHMKCPDALLVLIGNGHLFNETKALVDRLGLSNSVRFMGTRFDMNELMQGMDVFLFPSMYEGLGNVITEAQAVGLQCVVSEAVPNEAIMTDLVETILLKKNAAEWAENVLKYNNGYIRRSRSDELRKAGYDILLAAKDLEKYYYTLVGENYENIGSDT